MPNQKCERCGETISYSKIDRFEDIHICFSKFKDRLNKKPVVIIEEKNADKVFDAGTSETDIGEIETKASTVSNRNKYTRRRD